MRRLESVEDEINGVVTYELAGGKRARLNLRAVREYGAAKILRSMGHGDLLPTERVAVIQDGERIGTVPPDFDPISLRSMSFLYDPRPGDWLREGDVWVASRGLCPGDLEAVPGFVWDRPTP